MYMNLLFACLLISVTIFILIVAYLEAKEIFNKVTLKMYTIAIKSVIVRMLEKIKE